LQVTCSAGTTLTSLARFEGLVNLPRGGYRIPNPRGSVLIRWFRTSLYSNSSPGAHGIHPD
jgi:hypothetical protein